MSDPFDSTALFAEFNRPRESSDQILLGKLKEQSPSRGYGSFSNGVGGNSGQVFQEKATPTGRPPSDSEDSTGAESENDDDDQKDSEDEGPLEVGRDDGGVLYRPGKREQVVGKRLLQQAKYTDGAADVGDNRVDDDEVQQLKRQNMDLKKCARLIDPTKHISLADGDEGPAIQILFMNHNLARKYRAEIERFISDLVTRDDPHNDRMEDIRIRPHNVCTAEGASIISDQQTHLQYQRTSTVIGCSRFYRDFAVDHMGWPLVDYIPALTDGWEIPRYQQQFGKALPADDSDDDTAGPKQQDRRPKQSCFNCGGNHRLDKCQEQRNFQRIAENRRKFMGSMPSRQPTLNEGHNVQMDPRFSKFKPGVISDSLRQALGIEPNQTPFYMYTMRQLGYPPGHLAACQLETSGIAMFDKHGRAMKKGTVGNSEENALEDGEMDEGDEEEQVVYDTNKLIEFPGFNVPVPEGFLDEGARLGFPPMMPHHAKAFMEKTLPTPKGVKRHHSDSRGSAKRQKVAAGSVDMELDAGAESEGQRRGLSRSSSAASFGTQGSGAETPTLEDLEEKRRLLERLVAEAEVDSQDSTGQSSQQSSRAGSVERFAPPLPPVTPEASPGPSGSSTPVGTAPTLPGHPSGDPCVTPVSTHRGRATSSSGTPMVDEEADPFSTPLSGGHSFLSTSSSASISRTLSTPVTKIMKEPLPDVDNFKSGVQDHIPFENLPNTTGTYNKMKDIIANIRMLRKAQSS